MSEYKYSVFVNNICLAKSMDLDGATIFIKALFQAYYNDKDMQIMLQRDDAGQEENTAIF